ncbi:MAG: BrnT family toxin [Candidatus Pacebacteria bacterium]|nr:BrnT family toxin [Candidatus Paceibacterota bacterium]
MKYFDWDGEKNEWLIENRGISFEMCIVAINQGDILSQEPNKMPYSHQKRYILNINNYVYVVPYVEDDEKIFLKTIYPSRKLKKKYPLT